MTTIYPNGIDTTATLPNVVDNTSPVVASDINTVKDAVIAVENELGIDPSREFDTVRQRLDYLQGAIGGIQPPTALSVKKDGATVVNPTDKINFKGNFVSVTNAGAGQADVEVVFNTTVTQETISVVDNQTLIALSSLPMQPETVQMFVNGEKQHYGQDYTVTASIVTYTSNPSAYPLLATDVVEFFYITHGAGAIQETVTVTSGGQTLFSLSQIPLSNASVEMYINGQKKEHGTEYTIFGSVVTYTGAFPTVVTDVVEFWYLVSGAGGGGGGSQTLSQTLSFGNTTGNHPITITGTDKIQFNDGYIQDDGTFHIDLNTGINYVLTTDGAIIAGYNNTAPNSKYSTISGGLLNIIDGYNDPVNEIANFIGVGYSQNITGQKFSAIVAGQNNHIYTDVGFGGTGHTSSDFIGSGDYNAIRNSSFSGIVGGHTNIIYNSNYSFIGTGQGNTLNNSNDSAITSGKNNIITQSVGSSLYNFIGAGENNNITDSQYSSILGGHNNTIDYISSFGSDQSVISGGAYNHISGGSTCTINGGNNNHITFSGDIPEYSVIVGGDANSITGARLSTILGGRGNVTTAKNTLVSGYYAHARLNGQEVRSNLTYGPGGQKSEIIASGSGLTGSAFNLQLPSLSASPDGYITLENITYDMSIRILVRDNPSTGKVGRWNYDVMVIQTGGVVTISDVVLVSSYTNAAWTTDINNGDGTYLNIHVGAIGADNRIAIATVEWREL